MSELYSDILGDDIEFIPQDKCPHSQRIAFETSKGYVFECPRCGDVTNGAESRNDNI